MEKDRVFQKQKLQITGMKIAFDLTNGGEIEERQEPHCQFELAVMPLRMVQIPGLSPV